MEIESHHLISMIISINYVQLTGQSQCHSTAANRPLIVSVVNYACKNSVVKVLDWTWLWIALLQALVYGCTSFIYLFIFGHLENSRSRKHNTDIAWAFDVEVVNLLASSYVTAYLHIHGDMENLAFTLSYVSSHLMYASPNIHPHFSSVLASTSSLAAKCSNANF